jgi:hypothetical protein
MNHFQNPTVLPENPLSVKIPGSRSIHFIITSKTPSGPFLPKEGSTFFYFGPKKEPRETIKNTFWTIVIVVKALYMVSMKCTKNPRGFANGVLWNRFC